MTAQGHIRERSVSISETEQDRHTVTADHQWKMICGLLNFATASDLERP